MKLTVKQLRNIIAEEVQAAPASPWSAETTAASDPAAVAAALPRVLGKPAARPEICGELAAAIVAAAKAAVGGAPTPSLERGIIAGMETTVDPEAPGRGNVVFSATDMRRIIDGFLGTGGAKKPAGGSLRDKWSDAFDAVDDHTRSGRAERDWTFYEEAPPGIFAGKKHRPKVTLWADPAVSGDSMWWDPKAYAWGGAWKEDDGSLVWRD